MKKKVYLKEKVETFLVGVVLMAIAFIAMTIESIGNPVYDKILVITIIVMLLIMKVLTKFGRSFNED